MAYTNPTVADFKAFFVRDFPYGTNINTNVLDADVARAMLEASQAINQCLFPVGQSQYTIGFFYLSAHNLVTNIKASSQGIASQNDWLVTTKSVGNVSTGSQVPQRILDNPEFAALGMTSYGWKYLMIVMPYLNGAIFAVAGATKP